MKVLLSVTWGIVLQCVHTCGASLWCLITHRGSGSANIQNLPRNAWAEGEKPYEVNSLQTPQNSTWPGFKFYVRELPKGTSKYGHWAGDTLGQVWQHIGLLWPRWGKRTRKGLEQILKEGTVWWAWFVQGCHSNVSRCYRPFHGQCSPNTITIIHISLGTCDCFQVVFCVRKKRDNFERNLFWLFSHENTPDCSCDLFFQFPKLKSECQPPPPPLRPTLRCFGNTHFMHAQLKDKRKKWP